MNFTAIRENVKNADLYRHMGKIEKIISDLEMELSESTRRQLFIILDYCISGICTLYIDILSEKIPVSLEDSAEYIANLLSPQRNVIVEVLQQMQK